jgi:hypothetical protein
LNRAWSISWRKGAYSHLLADERMLASAVLQVLKREEQRCEAVLGSHLDVVKKDWRYKVRRRSRKPEDRILEELWGTRNASRAMNWTKGRRGCVKKVMAKYASPRFVCIDFGESGLEVDEINLCSARKKIWRGRTLD